MLNFKRSFFFVTAVFTVTIIILMEITMTMIDSPQYSIAVNFIKTDSLIRKNYGVIKDLGIPSGKLNTPIGNCYFKVEVKGEFKTGKIGIKMKEYNYHVWKVTSWEDL